MNRGLGKLQHEADERRQILLSLEGQIATCSLDGNLDKKDWESRVVHRCAELRASGVKALPYLSWKREPSGHLIYTLQIYLPGDRTFESET